MVVGCYAAIEKPGSCREQSARERKGRLEEEDRGREAARQQHGSIRVRVGQGQSESLASLNKRKTQREAGEDNDDAPSP